MGVGSSKVEYEHCWFLMGCRIKRSPDESIGHHKARGVAKGFRQNSRINFFETFSPMAKASTIRVVLSLAMTVG